MKQQFMEVAGKVSQMLRIDDDPLKICLLSYRSNPHCGGQGVYVKNLSRSLQDLGHQVDIVSGPPVFVSDNGIRIHPLPGLDLYNPDHLFRVPSVSELMDPVNLVEWLGVCSMGFPEPYTFGQRAFKLLKKTARRYDIVHDNQSLSYGVRKISRLAPTIATIHHPITVDRDLAVRSAKTFWKKLKEMRWYAFIRMQKRVAKTFSHIITVSKHSRRDISTEFRIPPGRFRIIPNGVDTTLFFPMPAVKREPNRIIVTNSADTPLKGLPYLLKALSILSKTRDAKLVVIGAPKKNGGIETLIRDLDIANRIVFTGRIDQKEFVTQYARAAVAVIPSVYEGFGLPAIEAMACAVPVVSTTGGALPEVVDNAGILVPPKNEQALADAIAAIFDNPEQASRLGRAGYKRVQEHFSWNKAAEKTVAAYRETIRAFHRR
ncbi:MAG: glycosyltransferase family 4 protein [Thermodesulfobacteriota bacterium]